jgi:hypothetical protein
MGRKVQEGRGKRELEENLNYFNSGRFEREPNSIDDRQYRYPLSFLHPFFLQ